MGLLGDRSRQGPVRRALRVAQLGLALGILAVLTGVPLGAWATPHVASLLDGSPPALAAAALLVASQLPALAAAPLVAALAGLVLEAPAWGLCGAMIAAVEGLLEAVPWVVMGPEEVLSAPNLVSVVAGGGLGLGLSVVLNRRMSRWRLSRRSAPPPGDAPEKRLTQIDFAAVAKDARGEGAPPARPPGAQG